MEPTYIGSLHPQLRDICVWNLKRYEKKIGIERRKKMHALRGNPETISLNGYEGRTAASVISGAESAVDFIIDID